MKINQCPYCKNPDPELDFVEVTTSFFENGIAIECLDCGCRSMATDANDGESMAVKVWNEMRVVREEQ